MRPAPTVSCAECQEAWPAKTSRFCGRCGRPLARSRDGGTSDRAPRRWSTAGGAALLAIVALAGLVVGGSALSEALASRPGTEVDLPGSRELVPQRGLTGADARAALAPFDPDQLRCEPDGCERWRLHLPEGFDAVHAFGQLLVLQAGDTVVALDAVSGEQRWTVPLDPDGAGDRSVGRHQIYAADEVHLAMARDAGVLRLVDRHGQLRWHVPVPAAIWDLRVLEDAVVTLAPSTTVTDGNGGAELTAFDVRDGTVRWRTPVREMIHTERGLFAITEEGQLVRIDPDDGTITVRYGDAHWATELSDGLLVLWHDDGAWLADADRGDRLLDLGGIGLGATLVDGDVVYLLDEAPAGEPRQILALELDGTVRWRREIPRASRQPCCVTLTSTDDRNLHVHDPGGAGWILDAATGADLPHRDPPPVPTGEYWTGSVWIRHGPGGRLTVTSSEGIASIEPGDAWLVLEDPLVVAGRDTLLGVELTPPPVGPLPATRLPAS